MSIFLRIWLAFAVVLMLGAYFTINLLQEQIKPSVKQAIEDTLADNANIMATLLAKDIAQVSTAEFRQQMQSVWQRQLAAQIWQYQKQHITEHLYITDAQGVVLYDSLGKAVGQDFSRWNDVRRTLSGRYGARTTRLEPNNEASSTMYVAAPIIYQGRLVGVLTLSKESQSLQPFIEQAQQEMLQRGLLVVLLALILSALVAWWLRQGIYKVAQYARQVTRPHQSLEFWAAKELNSLVAAIDQLRTDLEGKHYIERYVHTLTHELKSPLTSIKACAELLQEELASKDRQRFSRTISQQTQKLQQLVDRLLVLARLEQRAPLERQHVDLLSVMQHILDHQQARISTKKLSVTLNIASHTMIYAEQFWLEQAITNIIDNALDFSPVHGALNIYTQAQENGLMLVIENKGTPVPDYALAHIFDRFYSLARPDSQQKSTGLGLTLVNEVMQQHQGQVSVTNIEEGVRVVLTFSHPPKVATR